MAFQFDKHYTLEQARALLPQVRGWLKQLVQLRETLQHQEETLVKLRSEGQDTGGDLVNRWVRTVVSLQDVLLEFYRRAIQLKDLDRGLIDFPAIRDGKEVFLCWEQEEEDIEFWHDLDSGYAGREKL